MGPAGPAGPAGSTGLQGPQGIQGIPGPASPWEIDAPRAWFDSGNVGIGTGSGTAYNTHRLTVRSSSTAQDTRLVRLIGSGLFGQYGRLNFGDENWAYLEETNDDRLTLFASGLTFAGGDDGSAFTGGNSLLNNYSTIAATQTTTGNSAVYGLVQPTATTAFLSAGLWGRHNGGGPSSFAVYAQGGLGSHTGNAVRAEHANQNGIAILGANYTTTGFVNGSSGNNVGVYGVVSHKGSTTSAEGTVSTAGVYGLADNTSTTGLRYGVFGEASTASTTSFAGYFKGRVKVSNNLQVVGTLSKGGGTFKIDHPLDPENKYLYHSFVESPDMKNVYDGVATLDAQGRARVQLPEYFEALNRDFRYQLTCIGAFAPVYVATRVRDNAFTIAGGLPGMEVSWQVTGIRKDAYAVANPVIPEVDKGPEERGRYLHPGAFGKPESQGVLATQEAEPNPNTLPASGAPHPEPVRPQKVPPSRR